MNETMMTTRGADSGGKFELDESVHLAEILDVAHARRRPVLHKVGEEGGLERVALACDAQPQEG